MDATNLGIFLGYLHGLALYIWQNTNFWALSFAVLTPVLIIFGRQEVRIRRVRQIFDFERTFDRIRPKSNIRTNPSFEFVRSKYLSDIDSDGAFYGINGPVPTGRQLEEVLAQIRWQGRRHDVRLLLSSIALMIVIYCGIDALMGAIACGFQGAVCPCAQTLFTQCTPGGGTPVPSPLFANLITIGGLAFAGAYVDSMRTFLRHLAVYDLSSYTFLRQTAETIAAVVFTMIAYAFAPDPLAPFTPPEGGAQISRVWIALAPILGLMPRSATQFVFTKTKNLIAWFKTEDDRFQKVTRITTPDVIDGVDFPTRFRLEICGIYDVQNLATTNPIMLHIESPYGIYQCIDWVAQAQLCHILGIERFLMMREVNIRSIFDLERAIDSRHGPDECDAIYAGILFATTDNLRSVAQIGKNWPMIIEGGSVKPVTVDEYCQWARKLVGTDLKQSTKCIEHVMRWIGDDLHVRRLRLVWNDICGALGPDSESLLDSKSRDRNGSFERGAGI
ncbi:hypothetical protein J2Y48_003838 [Mycoplana sp. BE70]|nr:hypothetical protein [Mycoplana sp. BE70]